ncbi:MAG: ATP-grasp domain-containing protein [Bacillota bacterium]
MESAFLTDAQQRKTLAAARSLGKRGIYVGAGEETRLALALFSKYCRKVFVYPSPRRHLDEFLDRLSWFLRANPFDVLFPMDDATLMGVARRREELESVTRVPIPEYHALSLASDKTKTLQLARDVGLACPRTVVPDSIEVGSLQKLASTLDFPVVVKPREGSGSRGMRYVSAAERLVPIYLEVHRDYPFPMIQEYIPQGEKYDVCLLFNKNSVVRAAFVQKELRGYPLFGGPSTLQESVRQPELVDMAVALAQAMGWYGVCEVEFMIDPRNGQPVLMEVNPRFWGSLQMSIYAGVDFPYLLYRMAMDGDVRPVFEYEVGLRCRWLLPGDTLHFLANPKRWEMGPGFFDFWDPRTRDDIISLSDPGPTVGFFLACCRYVFDPRMWRFVVTRR